MDQYRCYNEKEIRDREEENSEVNVHIMNTRYTKNEKKTIKLGKEDSQSELKNWTGYMIRRENHIDKISLIETQEEKLI